MKAAVYTKYGPPEVVSIIEVDTPKPKANEILIKIEAATLTAGDARLRASDFPPAFWLIARLIFGLFKPKKKILGHEYSGVVKEIGSQVSKFAVGDSVFGTSTLLKAGSHAEYICVPQQWKQGVVRIKPDGLSHKQAAAIPVGGMAALYLLEKAKISKGQNVLVYGASGSVGSYAVQLAKALGSAVTGVCSTVNMEMVQSLGAETVIDYKKDDFTTTQDRFDIIFDAVGKAPKSKAKKLLKKGGSYVSVNMITTEKDAHLELLSELAISGRLKAFVDKEFNLDQIVQAHAYVDSGRKRGNLLIIP